MRGRGCKRGAWPVFALALLAVGVGCAGKPKVVPQDTFWNNLASLCGHEFPGEVVADSTKSPTFRDRPLVLRLAECTEDTVTMPMLVGGRAWVTLTLSREDGALRLSHEHPIRDDGTSLTSGYGGTTRGTGSNAAQDFYADEFTSLLREKSADTVWTMEVRPGAVLTYSLRREGTNRRFRAVFDLKRAKPITDDGP